jgi:DCN1-like protein 1/2
MLQSSAQRSADKDTCVSMWSILFAPPSIDWTTANVDWRDEWLQFINDHKSIKGINRDQWNHVLKFAKLSLEDETLEFHSEEQSWPSIIDEFADLMKGKIKALKEDGEMEF